MPETEEGRRDYALDGLRGLAILSVIAYHYIFVSTVQNHNIIIYYLRAPLKLCWSGVDLFFVLSGFLITNILIKTRTTENYFRVFLIRRSARIIPLYVLVIVTFFLARFVTPRGGPLLIGNVPTWSYLVFFQNVFMWMRQTGGANWLGPTWSLAVEEQFYLFVPFLVLCLRRRMAMCVLAILIVAAPVLRWQFPSDYAFVATPMRADSLLLGSFLAYFLLSHRHVLAVRRHRRKVVCAAVVGLAGVPVMALRREWFEPLDFTWLAVLFGLMIVIVQVFPLGWLASRLSATWLVRFGELSFALYMFHQPVAGILHYATSESRYAGVQGPIDGVTTALAFVATYGLAALSGKYVEAPLRARARRFKYRLESGAEVGAGLPSQPAI